MDAGAGSGTVDGVKATVSVGMHGTTGAFVRVEPRARTVGGRLPVVLRALALAASSTFAGCAAGPPEPVRWDWEVEAGVDAEAVFAGHQELLDGFVANRSGRDLAAGDRVLLGMCVDGGGPATTRFVELEVVDPGGGEPGEATVRATVFDARRERLGSAEFSIVRQSLLGELDATCARFADGGEADADAAVGGRWTPGGGGRGSKAAGVLVLAEMVRVLESTPLLRDLLWECVSRPGLFTLLTAGPSVSFGAEFERSVRVASVFEERPCYRFPFLIRIAGEPALRCTVLATDGRPPLTLCGGILALAGESFDAVPRRVLVQVLAAHQVVVVSRRTNGAERTAKE